MEALIEEIIMNGNYEMNYFAQLDKKIKKFSDNLGEVEDKIQTKGCCDNHPWAYTEKKCIICFTKLFLQNMSIICQLGQYPQVDLSALGNGGQSNMQLLLHWMTNVKQGRPRMWINHTEKSRKVVI